MKTNPHSMEARMGNALLEMVILATGLPEGEIRRELQTLLIQHGKKAETLTTDELREMMAEYLQDVLLAAKERHS
jgi:predicted DNA-binding transcriptional regulator YafY